MIINKLIRKARTRFTYVKFLNDIRKKNFAGYRCNIIPIVYIKCAYSSFRAQRSGAEESVLNRFLHFIRQWRIPVEMTKAQL